MVTLINSMIYLSVVVLILITFCSLHILKLYFIYKKHNTNIELNKRNLFKVDPSKNLGFNSLCYDNGNHILKKSINPKTFKLFLGSLLAGYWNREVIFYKMNNADGQPKCYNIITYPSYNYELELEKIDGQVNENFIGLSYNQIIDIHNFYDNLQKKWKMDNHKHYWLTYLNKTLDKQHKKLIDLCVHLKLSICPCHGDLRSGNIIMKNGSFFLIDFATFTNNFKFFDYFYLIITSLRHNNINNIDLILNSLSNILNYELERIKLLFSISLLLLMFEIKSDIGLGYSQCFNEDLEKMNKGTFKWKSSIEIYYELFKNERHKIETMINENFDKLFDDVMMVMKR
jgi:hypothetical protein